MREADENFFIDNDAKKKKKNLCVGAPMQPYRMIV